MQDDNFAFAVMKAAYAHPERVAFDGSGGAMTYKSFADLVIHFARRMREFGVNRTSVLSIATKSPLVSCVAVIATSLLGAQWRPFGGGRTSPDLPPVTHGFASGRESGSGAYEFTASWFEAPGSSVEDLARFQGYELGADTWMIASSSGTTGRPKNMAITYEMAWQRIVAAKEFKNGERPVLHSLFDALSYVGIRPRLSALAQGGTVIVRSPWSLVVVKHPTRVIGSPAQLAHILATQPIPKERAKSCRVTGAQVTSKFVELALQHFEEVEVLYGATETGAMATARYAEAAAFDGSVGPAVSGAAIEIIGEEDQPVDAGTVGEVRVRTPGMITHYLGEPELSAKIFRNGWFHPGDRGYLEAGGILHLTGRASDVLNVGGVKFNAVEVDEAIQQHPEVMDGYCFIDRTEEERHRLAAVIRIRPGGSVSQLGDLRDFATAKGVRAHMIKRIYLARAVPRNANGKPLRSEAFDLVRDMPKIELG